MIDFAYVGFVFVISNLIVISHDCFVETCINSNRLYLYMFSEIVENKKYKKT